MASAESPLASSALSYRICGPEGWKRRLEDPFNTYYRYPVALAMTRVLVHTRVTPNQVSLVQPVLAAVAGYLVTLDDWRYHLGAATVFELRSILDCVDGSLARAKKMSSPNGHAIDAMADWLSVVLLYAGIAHYLYFHPAPGYSAALTLGVVALALLQGALRSFASDYFKTKYIGIFERREDSAVALLQKKVLGLTSEASLFARIDVFIMRMGHLAFELERFDVERSKPLSPGAIDSMVSDGSSSRTRAIGFLWSISSGDAFLSFVIVSLVLGKLWTTQLFFATVGCLWIAAVVLLNFVYVRRYRAAQPR